MYHMHTQCMLYLCAVSISTTTTSPMTAMLCKDCMTASPIRGKCEWLPLPYKYFKKRLDMNDKGTFLSWRSFRRRASRKLQTHLCPPQDLALLINYPPRPQTTQKLAAQSLVQVHVTKTYTQPSCQVDLWSRTEALLQETVQTLLLPSRLNLTPEGRCRSNLLCPFGMQYAVAELGCYSWDIGGCFSALICITFLLQNSDMCPSCSMVIELFPYLNSCQESRKD